MTESTSNRLLLLPVFALFVLFLFETPLLRDGIQEGARLCYLSIIPAVFPFAALSAYLTSRLVTAEENSVPRGLARMLSLPCGGLTCFLIGILCGFPLGAKCVADGYRSGHFTKEEAERLLCFCNNTGPAFLVGGIGSMRGCVSDGWRLFFVQLTVAVLLALFTGGKRHRESRALPAFARISSPVSVSQAVTGAVNATLAVCGFVMFFSALLSVMTAFVPAGLLLPLACLLEVGTAARLAAHAPLGLLYTAFAVCFSGISVHLQAAAMLDGTDLSLRRYIPAKVSAGFLGTALLWLSLAICS